MEIKNQDHLKTLIKNGLINSIGSITVKLTGLVCIPIYTRLLTINEYGTWGIVQSIQILAVNFLSLGLSNALSRLYYDNQVADEKLEYTASIFWFLLLVGTISSFLFLTMSGNINFWLFHGRESSLLIDVLIISILTSLASNTCLSFLQIKIQPVLYSTSQILNYLVYNIVAVLLVWACWGIQGILLGAIIGNIISLVLVVWYLNDDILIKKYKFIRIRVLIKQGIPLMFVAIISWGIELSDRLFLNYYTNIAEVGLYSFSYQIVTVISFINWVFIQTVPIYLFKVRESDKKQGEFMQTEALRYYIILTLVIVLGLTLFSREIVQILAPASYSQAYKFVPLLSFSYVFAGCFYIFNIGIANAKKYQYLLYIFICAGIVNIIFNFLLIPKYAGIGAALSTVITYLVLMVLGNIVSQKVYYMEWKYKLPIFSIFLVISLAIIGNILVFNNKLLTISYKLAIMFTCYIVFWRYGISKNERTWIKGIIRLRSAA